MALSSDSFACSSIASYTLPSVHVVVGLSQLKVRDVFPIKGVSKRSLVLVGIDYFMLNIL